MMKSIDEKNQQETRKNNRDSRMSMSEESKVIVNKQGSLLELVSIISENNINITIDEIVKTINMYAQCMTDNQQLVFKSYYLRQSTIYDMKHVYNFHHISDVTRTLESATKKYIKILKEDYGTK